MSGADTHDHNQPIPIEPDLPSSRSLVFWIGSTVIVIVICCIALWRVLESGTRAEIERKTVKTKSPELVAITKNASTWLATGGRSFAYYETAMKVMLEKKWLKGDRADRVKALDPVSQALALRTILGENKAIAMLVDREVKRRIKSTRRVSIDHVISQTLRQPSLLDPLPAPPKTTPTAPTGKTPAPTPTAPTPTPTGKTPTPTPTAPTGKTPAPTPTAPTGKTPAPTPTAPTGKTPAPTPTGKTPTAPEKKTAKTPTAPEKKTATDKAPEKKTATDKAPAPVKPQPAPPKKPTGEKPKKSVETTKDAGEKKLDKTKEKSNEPTK